MIRRFFYIVIALVCIGSLFKASPPEMGHSGRTKDESRKINAIAASVNPENTANAQNTGNAASVPPAQWEGVKIDVSSPPDPAYTPQPYRLCKMQVLKKSTGGPAVRAIITTKERDMSKLTNHQLAGTVSGALQYFEAEYRHLSPSLVSVLLMPSCTNTETAIARAQVGQGRREVWEPKQAQGPSQAMLAVGDLLEKQKGGTARITAEADYREAGKALKMPAAKAKELDFGLAEYLPVDDAYPGVYGQPVTAPTK